MKHLKLSSTFDEQYNGNYSFLKAELLISCSYRRNLRAPRFRLKWKIKICFSSQKKSKQILSYEIEKNDLRKELYLLKNKAYNLRNFSAFASILKILHPQCIAIVCAHHLGAYHLRKITSSCRSVTKLNLDTRCRKSYHANITGYSSQVNNPCIPLTSNSRLVGVDGGTVIYE